MLIPKPNKAFHRLNSLTKHRFLLANLKNQAQIFTGKYQKPNKDISQENITFEQEKIQKSTNTTQFSQGFLNSQGTMETFVKKLKIAKKRVEKK